MTRQGSRLVNHGVQRQNGSQSTTRPRAMSSNTPSPKPEPEKNLIDLLSDDDLSQLGSRFTTVVTVSDESDPLGHVTDRTSECQPDHSQDGSDGDDGQLERDDPRLRNSRRNHPSHGGMPATENSQGAENIRWNSNGLPACFGLTDLNELCRRDGKNELVVQGRKKYYCYQHDPRNADLKCHAINKGNNKQCVKTCSYPSEIRAGGRPVCNQHFKLKARLIAL